MRTFHLSMTIFGCWLALGAALQAAEWRCPDCGCCEPPCRVKRLVPDVERVVHYEYFSRCETFCLQGPSRCVGKVQKNCCDPNATVPQYDKLWQPTCGSTFTCSRLCKRPVVEERPVMRCVVEDVCSRCNVAHAARLAIPYWARKKSRAADAKIAAGAAGGSSGRGLMDQAAGPSLPVISDVPLGASLPAHSPSLGR
jgi:hypothetical protein